MRPTPFLKYSTPRTSRIFFIAGPCVIESELICKKIADRLAKLSSRYKVDILFKASYDKANRLAKNSFRGPEI